MGTRTWPVQHNRHPGSAAHIHMPAFIKPDQEESAPKEGSLLGAIDNDLSHQEMERIIDELESVYDTQPDQEAWLPVGNIADLLCRDLGYEDMDEFEDALHRPFLDYINLLPHFETRVTEDGVHEFKRKPQRDPATLKPFTKILQVQSRNDLWRVLLKTPDTKISIPHMEFEIGADGKRKIDSVYNHIACAAFNLSQHIARTKGEGLDSENAAKIQACVDQLHSLLDVDTPWTLIVDDPVGLSEFKPETGIQELEYMGNLTTVGLED